MSGELYRIVLTGYYHVDITGYRTRKGEYYIEKDFAELFHIPREKVVDLFRHLPQVVKANLTYEEAVSCRDRIEAVGASCEIQDMHSHEAELSLAPD